MNFKKIGSMWINLDSVAYVKTENPKQNKHAAIVYFNSAAANNDVVTLARIGLDKAEAAELFSYLGSVESGSLNGTKISSSGVVSDEAEGLSGSTPS